MISTYTGIGVPAGDMEEGQMEMCKGFRELLEDERTEGRAEGIAVGHAEGRAEGLEEGADMLASLLKAIKPGSKDFEKALNATAAERRRLYKKYKIGN